MADPILTLSTLHPTRPKVPLEWQPPGGEVEHLEVELAVREDFGTFDHAELERKRMDLSMLMLKKDPTDAQRGTVKQLLNELARVLIIGGPDEAIRALPDAAKEDVVSRFFSKSDSQLFGMLDKLDPATIQTLSRLGSSLPDSSGSTEAPPTSGDE